MRLSLNPQSIVLSMLSQNNHKKHESPSRLVLTMLRWDVFILLSPQSVFLVGGFAASDWLFAELKEACNQMGLGVLRPDSHV